MSEGFKRYCWTFFFFSFLSMYRAQQPRSGWPSTSLNFDTPAFENAARCPNSETNLQRSDDRPMSMSSSAVDYLISLKFCTKFKGMTSEVLLKFKVKRSKVKVKAWHNLCKNSQNYQ